MKKVLLPVLVALGLTACGTPPQKPAAVEDRSAVPTTPGKPIRGPETSAVDPSSVSGSNISSTDPRKDPANVLSKRSIFFDYDSFEVKDTYRPLLEAHAGYLMAKRDAKVVIQGNTDDRGSREYNLALGQKRAEAVRKALAVMGVTEGQLEAVSFGEEKPRTEGDTEAAYADNRRADIVYGDE